MSPWAMLRMRSSSALSPTYLTKTPRTESGARKVELMTQPSLCSPGRRRGSSRHGHAYLTCILRSEDKERLTTDVT
jgi:hypothetical protein